MKSKTTRHGLKRMTALLLAVVLCVGMVPTAFAAQQDSYHDPAENWQEANNRTNELDANATVTHETFNCKVCKQQTSFIVFRTPEYTRDGQTAMSRNVKYSDGTFVDGSGKGLVSCSPTSLLTVPLWRSVRPSPRSMRNTLVSWRNCRPGTTTRLS